MHGAGEVLGSLEFAFDECLVDEHLGGDVGEFAPLPGFHLLSHRLKAALHAIDANRNAVNERKRLRVFREHRGKHAGTMLPTSSSALPLLVTLSPPALPAMFPMYRTRASN